MILFSKASSEALIVAQSRHAEACQPRLTGTDTAGVGPIVPRRVAANVYRTRSIKEDCQLREERNGSVVDKWAHGYLL